MVNKFIDKAIRMAGSQKKLATAIGVRQPTVWAWLHGMSNVSPGNARMIEIITEGRVPAYRLRPDLPHLFPHPNQKN